MAHKINCLPTAYTPQGNFVIGLVSHNTSVISNASEWSKNAFGFLIQLVSISNLCHRTDKHLGRKSKRGFVSVVNFVMDFEIIKNFFRPSNIRNCITNGIGFLNSFKKQFNLFSSWKKFDFQSQFHYTNIQRFSDI